MALFAFSWRLNTFAQVLKILVILEGRSYGLSQKMMHFNFIISYFLMLFNKI